MENPEVAQVFEEVADLLEIQGENPFRIRAYRNAARTIRDLSESLADMVRAERKLHELPGIGKDLAEKIGAILQTGELPLRQELAAKVPTGLRDLMHVSGLGPKRAKILFDKLKIDSLDKLREAAEAQRIRELKGFGEKTETKILESLKHVETTGKRVYLAEAKVFADARSEERRVGKEVRH